MDIKAQIEARIQRELAKPKTHEVVTVYADGTEKHHATRSAASAKTHYDFVEFPKLGRDLIDRETGKTVRVVSVTIKAL